MITCIYCGATDHQRKMGFSVHGVRRYLCTYYGRKYLPNTKPRAKPNPYPNVVECLNCGAETTNPKFCSQSCAASYTNRITPKRKATPRYCKDCGKAIPSRRKVCDACNPWNIDWEMRTIGELRRTTGYQAN